MMILSTGENTNDAESIGPIAAFTLIELILVMVLLAVVMALAAPRLSGFFKHQTLKEEATRFLALTRCGRNEALSQGIPMVLWVDQVNREYGLEAKSGYPARVGKPLEYLLSYDLDFQLTNQVAAGLNLPGIEFRPDGSLAEGSLREIFFLDRTGSGLGVVESTNGARYEIMRPEDYALRPSY